MSDTETVLRELLSRRILVLDGAMGTMIQGHHLSEGDFRGARFERHPRDLKGDRRPTRSTRRPSCRKTTDWRATRTR